ncbi:MAG TPA: hypothetical protein VMS31_17645, partial [Pyrinomonadaceae bacterium]|nr:hypothetical protein [Pyrinomonadaceae bacterium]
MSVTAHSKGTSLNSRIVIWRLLLCASCLFGIANTSLATSGAWQRQRTPSLAWLHAVFFSDQNRGWAVGSRGTLLATTNGGQSWALASRPTDDVIRDIYFVDE